MKRSPIVASAIAVFLAASLALSYLSTDPMAVLMAARTDAREGRHAEALDKFVWFFDHALEYDPSLVDFKLSVAVTDWGKLAAEHPPAMEQLVARRDAAAARVSSSDRTAAVAAFQEMAAINRALHRQTSTATVFQQLHAANSPIAADVFSSAIPGLVLAGDYKTAGAYIAPERDYDSYRAERQQSLLESSARQAQSSSPATAVIEQQFYEKRFANQVATLIALTVLNDRPDEAASIAKKALDELDDTSFDYLFEHALDGVLPMPAP